MRRFWSGVGFLLLLSLTACGATFGSSQAQQAATPSSGTTPIQIKVAGKPTLPSSTSTQNVSPATPTPSSTNGNASPSPTPSATSSSTSPSPTASPTNGNASPTASASSPTTQEQQLAQYVFGLINHDRTAKGLASYTWSNALASGARGHNVRMVAYGKIAHQCPNEPALGTRITNDGITWRAAGENIGWSDYSDPQQGLLADHQGMMAEQPPNDGHRQNILNSIKKL